MTQRSYPNYMQKIIYTQKHSRMGKIVYFLLLLSKNFGGQKLLLRYLEN